MLSEVNTYQDAVKYLMDIFKLINKELFCGDLPIPTITIQEKKGTYGHFTTSDHTWISSDGNTHEINIAAAHLSRPIANVVCTLVHECCHYFAFIKGIQDTSNRGIYHNARFRDLAAQHGLIVELDKRYGWSHTSPGEIIFDFCNKHNLIDITINRTEELPSSNIRTKKKSSSHKMVCPECGDIIRSTKEGLQVLCIICDAQFVYVD